MIMLVSLCGQTTFYVTQALTATELTDSQRDKLAPATILSICDSTVLQCAMA